jgi:hypothetical protein
MLDMPRDRHRCDSFLACFMGSCQKGCGDGVGQYKHGRCMFGRPFVGNISFG